VDGVSEPWGLDDDRVAVSATEMRTHGHLAKVRQGLTFSQAGAEKCCPSAGIDQQAGLRLPVLTVRPLHLYGDVVWTGLGVSHKVLTIDRGTNVDGMLEQQIIERRSHDIIGEGGLKWRGLKGKGIGPTALVLVTKGGPWFHQEASLAEGVVTAQAIK
jgi:hypothetical protein